MSQPWQLVEAVEHGAGRIELRRRGERDYLITLDGRVLMNSAAHLSERALGALAVETLTTRSEPHVLVAGLGMAFTLRGALDGLPRDARVRVVEIETAVHRWCRGPLRELSGAAVLDPRVQVEIADVANVLAAVAQGPATERFDAIALDLFEGPGLGRRDEDPIFGREGLRQMRDALAPGGVLAVWSEARQPAFEKRLARSGFQTRRQRPGRAGLRHAVYVARLVERGSPRKPVPSR